MNRNGTMDKWMDGLVPASLDLTYHIYRSSRRKEAPYSVLLPERGNLSLLTSAATG
jgi:hypothetical protein